MIKRRVILGALFGTAALVLSGCNPFWKDYRYKMTVEVQTPQGVKSGYAVRQVSFHARPNGGDGAGARGEAIAVDIAPGKTLFALLTGANGDSDYASWIASWALDRKMSPNGANKDYDAGAFAELYPTAPKTESPIYFGALPMLVTFRDIRDPKSIARVDAANLTTMFGAGVTLKRITVQKTREPVTEGIEERFTWWGKLKSERLRLNGSNSVVISTNELSDNIGTGAFSTMAKK